MAIFPPRIYIAAYSTGILFTAQDHHYWSNVGSAGGIGQPLALLLKMQPYVSELSLYDVVNTDGVAADLSHCNTPVKASLLASSSLTEDRFMELWSHGGRCPNGCTNAADVQCEWHHEIYSMPCAAQNVNSGQGEELGPQHLHLLVSSSEL